MNIGIAIVCRYSSARLPGKILSQIKGRAVLGHIVDRLCAIVPDVPFAVATSTDPADDAIESFCQSSLFPCFRGELDDVAGRLIACANSFNWDTFVRLNGDNLFVDPATLRDMLAIASTGQFDFVTNVPGRTFPRGMSVEILRTEFYANTMEQVSDPKHREHVTTWLYDNPDIGKRLCYENRFSPDAAGLDLALDTPEDLERANKIIESAGPEFPRLGLKPIVDLATRNARNSPWKGSAGPLLIAEIGGNHEGDFNAACRMTEAAIDAGADVVKFQIYSGDRLVSEVESPDRHKHFQRFELPRAQHEKLAQMCHDAGVGYLSSVWDLETLDWIDPYLDFYKIGSGDLTAWPLLRAFARRGKPILLSTGLATMDEVRQTVSQIQAIDAKYHRAETLCLLQCTSMYPIDHDDSHLQVMNALRVQTGLAVGYSDHTVDGIALRAATAMGADVLEFHFTLSRDGKSFRDHKVSLTPDELVDLKRDVALIRRTRGDFAKVPQASEIEAGHVTSFRRAAYLNRDMLAGETITEADVVYLRPAHGLDARDSHRLLGATARRPITALRALDPDADI